jgi:hypothetical protein
VNRVSSEAFRVCFFFTTLKNHAICLLTR